jgi:glutamate N-acetyltransferase/amino-acid N-acetyltransferase
MKDREFSLVIDLKQGKASRRLLTCDLSFDYVKINAEYTT